MAKRIVRDHEADGRERSDSPIICESSFGDNPDVRMKKGDYHKECRRPFTGLPVEVRDTALNSDSIPRTKSELHREFLADLKITKAGVGYYVKNIPSESIQKRQRTGKVLMWKEPTICGFYGRGECARGDNCPFRHVIPKTGDLSQQKIKENPNYYREIDDPVAMKILRLAREGMLEAPDDQIINTLHVGGLNSRVLGRDLGYQFRAYGEIESIRIFTEKDIAVVKFTTGEGAKKAAQELRNDLVVVNGQRLKLTRAGPQVTYPDGGSDQQGGVVAHTHSGLLPRAVISQQENQPPPMHPQPPYLGGDGPFYPQRMSAASTSSYPHGGYVQPPYQQYPLYHHAQSQSQSPN